MSAWFRPVYRVLYFADNEVREREPAGVEKGA